MEKGDSPLTADAPGATSPVDRVLRKTLAARGIPNVARQHEASI